ncbi:TIGR02302 family protein [Roseitranquillus sediminis]|uniref:TIGR02302 family protein n=1 Tax=Roseitranquillus sediminis TaxID=2809051 RepID=UPI001D0C289B|nr:TIGR02302 family protein [Roseitranquillus sediminis]MBM9593306.1 TIGR02302 family protein [Roseitranquillus sediminis]
MTDRMPIPREALRRLRRPLALTRLGMFAERTVRCFWPLATVLMALLAALMLGAQDALPLEFVWTGGVLAAGAFGWSLWHGARRFRWPGATEALDRLDRTLPGRPITAITDAQAIGTGDAASEAVWRAHVVRMANRARQARAVRPSLSVADRDPYALRYAALLALVMALLFGSFWRVASVTEMAPVRAGQSLAAGPSWEGWIEPPVYTGLPSLYLNDIDRERIDVPRGSRVTLRLYGEVGALTVSETVSGRIGEVAPASAPSQSFEVTREGALAVEGAGGARWEIGVLADSPPTIRVDGPPERTAAGELRQPFTASDDYGVIGGNARLALDLAALERRHGLAVEPEPREPVVIDLPLSLTGETAEYSEVLAEDFAKHPWAGMPVTLRMTARDAAGQEGMSAPDPLVLPERRFFDPLAAAIAEQRRDLLWTRENAGRVAQILRAVSWHPEDVFRSETAYLRLRVIIRRLENYNRYGEFTTELQDEIADALWDVALMIEEGDLGDAMERLRRAQERLGEAMESGASDEEIAELMQELREAMQDYMRQLAEQSEGQEQEFAEGETQEITGDQLEQMLQQLQELMEQGRMAEAQQLLQQLQQMMENMQIAQGQQQGQSPGQQAMEDLAETLREQQELNDETFGDLQEQFDEGDGEQGQQPGQQQGQQGGQTPGQQQGQQGQQGQGNQSGQSQQSGQGAPSPGQRGMSQGLADRQQALRDELARQQGSLPGAGTPSGDAARESLDRAGRAMEGAEEALRGEDFAGALDRQSEALDALREGMRNLGEAMAQEQQQNGQAGQGEAFGQADGSQQRDPLGRMPGAQGRVGTDEQLLQGEDVYRRARELLDEIRRRSGEQERPEQERDYLRRLLDRF